MRLGDTEVIVANYPYFVGIMQGDPDILVKNPELLRP